MNGHGTPWAVLSSAIALVERVAGGAMGRVGGALSPSNAWLIMRSATLPLGIQRHCEGARAVADFLDKDPRLTHVTYPAVYS